MSKLMNKAELLELTGLSYPYVWKLMCRDQFPRSIQLSDHSNSVRWYTAEVEEWLATRKRTKLKVDKLAEAAAE